MTLLLQFECRPSVERATYFLKNSVVLFVALFTEMLALKTEDHLASPLGREKTCAARCHKQFYQDLIWN
jgi:hypothetical protein